MLWVKDTLNGDIRVLQEEFHGSRGGGNVALVQRYCSCEFKSKIIITVNTLKLFCKFEVDVNTGCSP